MSTVVPSHTLPGGAPDRRTRVALVIVACLLVLAIVGTLVAASVASAISAAAFPEGPGTQTVGRPTALTVSSGAGRMSVRTSDDVQQVTVQVTGARTRARIERHTAAIGTVLRVDQPVTYLTTPWSSRPQGIEILIPTDLAPTMGLTAQTDSGDLTVTGTYATLTAGTDVGDLNLRGVTAREVHATASVGDVDLHVADGATPGSVEARADTGDVTVRVPGSAPYDVDASADVGDRRVAPGIATPGAARLVARSDVGDVTVTR